MTPPCPAHLAALGEAQRLLFETWLVAFDQGWHEGALAARVQELPADGPLRRAALVEMVKIDLERHAQHGRHVPAADYLRAYPELADATVPLAQAESQVRDQFGDTPASPNAAPRERAAGGLPETFGRYRIVKKLGEGGMGTVYLAHDPSLDRPVALKVPRFTRGDAEVLERFYREARAVAALRHANLCPVYDVGAVDGLPYLTMAYLEGQLLSERIDAGGPWPEAEACDLVRRLALALAEAHEHGVIHRDLKPGNIMLTRGEPVLMDFGLARRLRKDEIRLTAEGALVGTPAYMAPEQVAGNLEAIGPATDIYSLGVVLYELLTGRLPFQGDLTDVLLQIQGTQPSPPSLFRPGLDRRLDAVCLRALAKKPADRYPSMRELAAALADYRRVPRPTFFSFAGRLGLAGLIAVVLLLLGGVALWRTLPTPVRTQRTTEPLGIRTTEPLAPTLGEVRRLEGTTKEIVSVAFADGGRRALSFAADRILRVWDVDTGQEVIERRRPFTELTTGLLFSPDGRYFLAASLQRLTLRDGVGKQELVNIDPGTPHLGVAAFSGDGRRFVVATVGIFAENRVKVWDAETGQPVGHWEKHPKPVVAVALSADGRRALSAAADGVFLWEVATGKELLHLEGPTVREVAFAPDGKRFLTGDAGGTLQLHDCGGTEPPRPCAKHGGAIVSAVFSPDGRYLVSSGEDGTLCLWDVSAERERCHLDGTGVLHALAFTPDGHRLLGGGADGSLRLWKVE